MRVPSVLAAGLLAALTACSSSAPVAAPPTAPPTAPPAAPSGRPSPPPDSPSAPPVPVLPPVQDATGLPGDQLVAAPALRLPGAQPDGTARLEATGRTYLLGPARRAVAGSAPGLLLVLPAANTTLREEYDRYGLDDLRDHGLTVAVVGTYAASWNAGACCGRAAADRVDDVAAVTAVREDVLRGTGADRSRVAVVGHSVGALMVWRLACTPEFGAAAAVVVAGTRVHPCPQPVPRLPHVLALHGEQDASVPLAGSSQVVPLLGIAPPAVLDSATGAAQAGRCAPRRTQGQTLLWPGCAGGSAVRLTVLPGRGHAWEDLDATRRAAAFLREVLPGVR